MDLTHRHGRDVPHSHPHGRYGGWGCIHHHVTLTLGTTTRKPKLSRVSVWPTVCECGTPIIEHADALPCGVTSR